MHTCTTGTVQTVNLENSHKLPPSLLHRTAPAQLCKLLLKRDSLAIDTLEYSSIDTLEYSSIDNVQPEILIACIHSLDRMTPLQLRKLLL